MFNELTELQFEQQRHDELAHRDILCLPVQDRIKHMVLHFAKYSGHFAELYESHDENKFTSTLIDTFIICLASANTLNIKLAPRLQQLSVKERCSFLDQEQGTLTTSALSAGLFPLLAQITGTMAKACESLDHLEEFDFRGTLERGVISITSLTIVIAQTAGLDLPLPS